MKIIKQGKSKEELNKPKIKRFECYKCECVFEADETEYKADTDYIYTTYSCGCPNCGESAFEQLSSRRK